MQYQYIIYSNQERTKIEWFMPTMNGMTDEPIIINGSPENLSLLSSYHVGWAGIVDGDMIMRISTDNEIIFPSQKETLIG